MSLLTSSCIVTSGNGHPPKAAGSGYWHGFKAFKGKSGGSNVPIAVRRKIYTSKSITKQNGLTGLGITRITLLNFDNWTSLEFQLLRKYSK